MLQIVKTNTYYLLVFYNALLSWIFILFDYKVDSLFFFFSLMMFGFILIKNSSNIITMIRTFFLAIIGFMAMGTKFIDDNAWFGHHMQESQSIEIATLMFLLTNIALFGSEIGFLLSSNCKIISSKKLVFEGKTFFYITFILLIFVSYLISLSRLNILTATYGSGGGVSMPLSNLNAISNILFYSLILLYFKFTNIYNWSANKYKYLIIFSGIFLFLYSEILHGVRMDALNGIFGAVILYLVYSGKSLRLNWKIFLLGALLFVIFQVIGMVRSSLQSMTLGQHYDLIIYGFSSIFTGSKSGILFYQGTINDIATTFSGIIMMLEENMINFYYGSSYFDYILRIPPAFIYPDRPQDLAWIFVNNGLTSGGGFFELAEAYLNFGVMGVLIVPFIISFLFGYGYKLFIYNKYSLLGSMLLFGLLSSFLRGILYQSFALYKSVITGFIIIMFFFLIRALIKKRNYKYFL